MIVFSFFHNYHLKVNIYKLDCVIEDMVLELNSYMLVTPSNNEVKSKSNKTFDSQILEFFVDEPFMNLLQQADIQKDPSLPTYLAAACAWLKDGQKRKTFAEMASNSSLPSLLREDIKAVAKEKGYSHVFNKEAFLLALPKAKSK